MLRKKGMLQLPLSQRDKTEIDIIIESAWSSYCDLDNWVRDMGMRGGQEVHIPKAVVKMAMRHLRDEALKIHTLAAQLQEDKENANS